MHGIAAITGNMHRSLRYFVLLERITSYESDAVCGNVCICVYVVFVCVYVMYPCLYV